MREVTIALETDLFEGDPKWLQEKVIAALEYLKVPNAEISLILLDNNTIHEWNRNTLGHDYPTDVITFPFHDMPRPNETEPIEGELLISFEMASQIAADIGWPAHHETLLYAIHGVLHLLGYDDLTSEDQHVMRQRELEVLSAIDVSPLPADDRWADNH